MNTTETGKLYIVSTPIGNLEDITLRALKVLREVDMIAAEDTRRTKILLNHFEIKTRTVSYHSFNEHRKTMELLEKVASGLNLAVVSDAGTPCIADPGFLMVREALKMGIEPETIPGVSSLTFAVAASGLPSDRFSFYGFLPVKPGKKQKVLEEIRAGERTAVVFESPYRVEKTLKAIAETVGPMASVSLVREATKMHEQIIRGTAQELSDKFTGVSWKGEFVMVINPGGDKNFANDEDENL